jgi:hypothetical protein
MCCNGVSFPSSAGPLSQVVELLAAEKGWGRWRRRQELKRGQEFLRSFRAAPGPPQVLLLL